MQKGLWVFCDFRRGHFWGFSKNDLSLRYMYLCIWMKHISIRRIFIVYLLYLYCIVQCKTYFLEGKNILSFLFWHIFINSGNPVHCLVWNSLADILMSHHVHFTCIFIYPDPCSGCGLDHCARREPHRNLHCHSSS